MNLETIGHAAARHQTDPRLLEIGLRAGGILEPKFILNGKRYFKTCDILEAVVWLARHEAEKDCCDDDEVLKNE